MLSARVSALCPQPGPRPDATLLTVQCRPARARHSVTPFFVWSSLCLISQHYSLSPMYPSQHYTLHTSHTVSLSEFMSCFNLIYFQCTIENWADTTLMFSKGLYNIDVMFLLNVMSFNFYKTVGGILWS